MTGNRFLTRRHAGGVVALVSVTLLVAACGGSSGSNKASSPPASPPASSDGSGGSVAKITITTAKGSAGTYLIGARGRALYLWAADSNGQSSCSGACAKVWPPVLASVTPSVSGGATASDLGLATRSNGLKQVTYNGHPLYYYSADPGSGTTHGEGSSSFGAKWWLVSPSGAGITKSSSAKSSSGGSSGGGGWG